MALKLQSFGQKVLNQRLAISGYMIFQDERIMKKVSFNPLDFNKTFGIHFRRSIKNQMS